MLCPRCREENNNESKVCSNCGLKLKVTCPRCKNLNPIGQERCSNCNLKLISFCPQCKAPNIPTAENCRKCNLLLLKECPSCHGKNPVEKSKCIKCGKDFNIQSKPQAMPEQVKAETQDSQKVKALPPDIQAKLSGLNDYAVLCAELINLSAIKAKIKRDDIVLKLRDRFLQIVAAQASNNSETALKVSDQIAAVEFRHSRSTILSGVNALNAAQNILNEINELNFQIKNNLNIKLKVKIGVAVINEKNKGYLAQFERSAATAESVIVNTKLYNLTSDKFDFETVGPLPVKNAMMTFYKLTESVKIKTVEPIIAELPDPEPTSIPEEVSMQDEPQHYNVDAEKHILENSTEENHQLHVSEEHQPAANAEPEFHVSMETGYNFLLNNFIQDDKISTVGICAPDGAGKTSLITSVRQSLADQRIIWLLGNCQYLNQAIPFGYFQDMLKTLFSLPPFIVNIEETKKTIAHSMEVLSIKDKQVENILYKLLLCELDVDNVDIFKNLQNVYDCFESIINAINAKARIVFIIEDFNYIDPASLDCIKYLINNGLLDKKVKLIFTYSEDVNLNDHLFSYGNEHQVCKLYLNPMTEEEMNSAVMGMLNKQDILPTKLKSTILKNSKGLPIYLEQALWLLFQLKIIYGDESGVLKFDPEKANIELPVNVEDIIKIRIAQFNKLSEDTAKIIVAASMFGERSIPGLVQALAGVQAEQFTKFVQVLLANGIFVRSDKYSIAFKHKIIWEIIYESGLNDEQKAIFHNRTLQILKNYTRINGAALAIHSEIANEYQEALNYWNQASKEAVSVGDVYSYTKSQERVLALIDEINFSEVQEKEDLKLNIYEQLGKVNYEINPEDAVKFLSNAIITREAKKDIVQVIELAGYLSRSCEILGNYSGVIECTDKALAGITKEEMPIECALLNYSKIEAILNLGRLEEAIVIAKNDILPAVKSAIAKGKSLPGITSSDLSYIYLESELILAKALAVQGNKEAVATANSVALKANELEYTDIEVQARLVDALFKVLQGEVKSANAVLEYLKGIIPEVKKSNSVKLYWGMVNILSNLYTGNFDAAKNISYSVLALAEESKDYCIQSIIRLILGKLLKELKDFEKAKLVYNEVINHCSERKFATGALLGWYFIADAEIAEADIEKAQDIAERALEIAEKSGINNYLFVVMLRRLIAEIQIIKGDFESAQIYIEQALEIAEKMDLFLLQSKLYLTFGKIYQENAAVSDQDRQVSANNAHRLFMKSLDIAQKLENYYMINKIEKELSDLTTFCQLSGIKI